MIDWGYVLSKVSFAILIVTFCGLFDFAAIACDLITGVRKAKAAGIFRQSKLYRNTVRKATEYMSALFMATVLDCFILMTLMILQSSGCLAAVPFFPVVTVITGLYNAFCEFRSVLEKRSEKDKRRIKEDMAHLAEFLKDKDKMEYLAGLLRSMNGTTTTVEVEGEVERMGVVEREV